MEPRPGGDLRLLQRVLQQARPMAPHVLGIVLLDVLSGPLALLAPLPLKIAVDNVVHGLPLPPVLAPFGGELGSLLLFAAAFSIAIALLTQAHSLAVGLLRTYVGERLTLAFRSRLFGHAQRISFGAHDQRGTSDQTYRIQHDSDAVRNLVAEGLSPFVGAVVQLVTTLYVMWWIDRELALIALAVSPVLFLLARAYRPTMRRHSRKVKGLESEALGVIQEVLGALRVVKAFGQEEREQARFARKFDQGLRARLRLVWMEGRLGLLLALTTGLGTAAVLFVGARNVQAGALTVGALWQVMAYLSQLYSPLKMMSRKVASVQMHLAGAERAFALLDQPCDVVERPDARPLDRARGDFVFERVTFAYPGSAPVLRDASFRIAAGTRVGLAGETGSGKTTLAGLLLRFHDPVAGRILLDGTDLCNLRLRDLRGQFSVVPQDAVLFSTTIEENIAYARPEASHEEVVAAARAAGAHTFIESFPDGYGTSVGERGMRLSGGERQRVALARAFLKDAPILVLDEPTSALDPATEREVLEAMERLMRGRTTLIIAHRPSTLEACDQVLVLRDGALFRTVEAAS